MEEVWWGSWRWLAWGGCPHKVVFLRPSPVLWYLHQNIQDLLWGAGSAELRKWDQLKRMRGTVSGKLGYIVGENISRIHLTDECKLCNLLPYVWHQKHWGYNEDNVNNYWCYILCTKCPHIQSIYNNIDQTQLWKIYWLPLWLHPNVTTQSLWHHNPDGMWGFYINLVICSKIDNSWRKR